MCIYNKMPGYDTRLGFPNYKMHLYEIEHNFEIERVYDIFYNFCLNNFVNSTIQIEQLYLWLNTNNYGIDDVITCEIGLGFNVKGKIKINVNKNSRVK